MLTADVTNTINCAHDIIKRQLLLTHRELSVCCIELFHN